MAAGVNRQGDKALRVGVAVSGGLDSTALLHCVVRLARRCPGLLQVHVLHVNHGLQPEAEGWQRYVATQCRRWSRADAPVSFHAARLDGKPGAGESVEAWARKRRYEALAHLADQHACALVLLAHHRSDQAETVLLQALRAAGPAGLAGMPAISRKHGIMFARPWLGRSRPEIADYAQRFRLSFVEDPSNASPRFARNRLRVRLMPALRREFPDAEAALAGAARRAHEADCVLAEVAAQDAATALDGTALRLAAWLLLSDPRRRNLIRSWLGAQLPSGVPETLVARLALELPDKQAGRWPVGGGELRLHAGLLSWEPEGGPPHPNPAPVSEVGIDLSRPGSYRIPGWQGRMQVEPVRSGGVEAMLLQRASVRPRQGAEQFQRAELSTPRSLKKQFQALLVPPWGRDGPLVWAGEQLVFVAGLGIDARCLARPGSPQHSLRWLPEGAGDEGEASGSAG